MNDAESPPASERPAEYTVVARRYRPQQFKDLIGQETVAQALSNALTGSRVAHAYLFTGARGVGKTSAARILAKALNCENGPTPTPCDVCDICKSITSGEDVDVSEIDGASNRGIDDIRELRQNVQFRPSRARFKIYIIDEVHMLTRESFNALLKTLEEPPAGVKFIFATTEVNKVPVTILSRCQRFDFGLIATPRIAAHLTMIVAQEKLQADSDALDMIARRAAGSMRDAESLLDQILAYGETVTATLVHRLLGTIPAERIAAMAQAIQEHQTATALQLLDAAQNEGAQIGELIDQLVECWRDLLLAGSCGDVAPNSTTPAAVVNAIIEQTSVESILAGLDILTATKSRMKFSGHAKVLTEMAIIRLSRIDQLIQVGDAWSAAQSGEQAAPAPNIMQQRMVAAPVGAPEPEKKKLMSRLPPASWN